MSDTITTGDGIRDWARFDVSGVPLQGGYIAKQCPVRAQNDILRPVEPAPPDPVMQRRFDAGNVFERDMAELVVREAIVDQTTSREERERATIAAMRESASVIFGGRLPADEAGRRVGEPDLLVRDDGPSANADWSYRPVDIKHHLTLNEAEGESALCSSLDSPGLAYAFKAIDRSGRKHKGDLLQLAHYQRMLEAAGWAAGDGRWGGIVGKEQVVVWWDLEEKIWRTPAVTKKTRMRTTMDVYDFEFAFRLDIMAAAAHHQQNDANELLVVPILNGECSSCPWWEHCGEQLEADGGDISLLPRLGWDQWKMHRDVTGFTRRDRLATLDRRTADLLSAGVDVAKLLEEALLHPSATPISAVASNDRYAAALIDHGVSTVGDVAGLCATTAAYSTYRTGAMARHIDEARAALDEQVAFLGRDVDRIVVPRGDVEIDIDMENIEEGAYLWGTLLVDRSETGLFEPGYRGFVSWERSVDAFEKNFRDFWAWLNAQRIRAAENGLAFRAYCYYEGAENGQMRQLAGGLTAEVESFITSPEWVDLYKIVRDHLITGESFSLKQVAPLSGFAWTVDDPGGDQSMVQYDLAVGGGTEAAAARRWLLEYNRNDVEATLELRNWLDETAYPSVADLDQVWHPTCDHSSLE